MKIGTSEKFLNTFFCYSNKNSDAAITNPQRNCNAEAAVQAPARHSPSFPWR